MYDTLPVITNCMFVLVFTNGIIIACGTVCVHIVFNIITKTHLHTILLQSL